MHHLVDRAHEAGDDRLRQAGRRDDTEPGVHADVRQSELGGGRHVGNIGWRLGPVCARIRSLPPCAMRALASPIDTISICPEIASVAICEPPR